VINETKKRVIAEFDRAPGFAWVTAGRTIENYLPKDIYETAVKKIYGNEIEFSTKGQYFCLTEFKTGKGKKKTERVKVARMIMEESSLSMDLLDLKEMMTRLIKFIDESNGRTR
jgi:hypothetical protein